MRESSVPRLLLCAAAFLFAAASPLAAQTQSPSDVQQLYDQGLHERQSGDLNAAIADLEKAHALAPQNANIDFDLAYAYRAAKRDSDAARCFEAGYAIDPRYNVLADWGYALKSVGDYKGAAEKFRMAIAARAKYPQATEAEKEDLARKMWSLKREVGMMEENWYADGYLIFRSPNVNGRSFFLPETSLAGSSAGAEVGWRPLDTTTLDLYARNYFAFSGNTLDYDPRTQQVGVGARWRPFTDTDLALSGERLIQVGSESRNDWLLIVADDWNTGAEFDPVRTDWDYTSVYGEAAYIPGSRHYSAFYGQALAGWRFKLSDTWALTPHAGSWATRTDDEGTRHYLVEAGVGLMLTHLTGVEDDHVGDSQASLSLQYRAAVADDIHQRNSVVLTLTLGI